MFIDTINGLEEQTGCEDQKELREFFGVSYEEIQNFEENSDFYGNSDCGSSIDSLIMPKGSNIGYRFNGDFEEKNVKKKQKISAIKRTSGKDWREFSSICKQNLLNNNIDMDDTFDLYINGISKPTKDLLAIEYGDFGNKPDIFKPKTPTPKSSKISKKLLLETFQYENCILKKRSPTKF